MLGTSGEQTGTYVVTNQGERVLVAGK